MQLYKSPLKISLITFLLSCALTPLTAQTKDNFTIAFGSCNKTSLPNLLWDDIQAAKADVFIWGGDIVYADTENMKKLKAYYEELNEVPGYKRLKSTTPIIGTWDDHDYGMNDGGVHFKAKKESQQVFLDFMNVPQDSPRRVQEGVYASHMYKSGGKTIKVLVLDTRYFRSDLTPDNSSSRRNKPNPYGQGTILGKTQWDWLERELSDPKVHYNVIVSSVQFLSSEHGFECWGNFPHEVDKLEQLLVSTQAKNVIILSGDRHISEISKKEVPGLAYPLIDVTSSGLTHAYRKFSGEPNKYRHSSVVAKESFGLLEINTEKNQMFVSLITDGGVLEASSLIEF